MSDLFGHDLQDEVAVSRWAFALPPDERDRLLLATASVLAASGPGEDLRARPRASALLEALLPALAREADLSTRRELAERLSVAPWAPEALLLDLAEEAELAPVVARAPGLSQSALLRLAEDGNPASLAALARRPFLPSPVVERLILAAARLPALRDPLARRPDLEPGAAARLMAFVGPDLRRALELRYGHAEPVGTPETPDADAHLVDKLERAGRLTPAYAVNALRRGRPGVFGHSVARLADLAPATVAEALHEEAPDDLALACAAAAVDRAAFPTVLCEARALRGLPRERTPLTPEAHAAFDRPPAEAARLLRAAADRRTARWSPA
jgi:uncharacterized protein (DUF2336 family)